MILVISRKHQESSQDALGSKILARALRKQSLFLVKYLLIEKNNYFFLLLKTMIKLVNVYLAIQFSLLMSS